MQSSGRGLLPGIAKSWAGRGQRKQLLGASLSKTFLLPEQIPQAKPLERMECSRLLPPWCVWGGGQSAADINPTLQPDGEGPGGHLTGSGEQNPGAQVLGGQAVGRRRGAVREPCNLPFGAQPSHRCCCTHQGASAGAPCPREKGCRHAHCQVEPQHRADGEGT